VIAGNRCTALVGFRGFRGFRGFGGFGGFGGFDYRYYYCSPYLSSYLCELHITTLCILIGLKYLLL